MATAMITGATSGIGLAFAHHMAARGMDLVLVARDAPRLEQVAKRLRLSGVDVEVLPADLAVREQVDVLVHRLEDQQQPVALLVNNAGFGIETPLASADTSVHDAALEVMCRSVLVLGGAAARSMQPRGAGAIINVASSAGFVALGGYSAIKAWVITYTEGLAVELHGTGVRPMALCPGWVHTEFHQRSGMRTDAIPSWLWLDVDEVVEEALSDLAMGRVISIPSLRYRVLMTIARHAPRSAIRTVMRAMDRRR